MEEDVVSIPGGSETEHSAPHKPLFGWLEVTYLYWLAKSAEGHDIVAQESKRLTLLDTSWGLLELWHCKRLPNVKRGESKLRDSCQKGPAILQTMHRATGMQGAERMRY